MDVRVLGYFQREIHVRRAPFETRWHYADDLVRLVNKLDGAADDFGVAHEIALPELIRQHHHRLRLLPRRRVGRNQPAPHQRANAPVIGRIRGNVHGLNIFGEIAIGGGEIPPVHGGDVFERLGLAKLINLRAVQARILVTAGFIHQPNLHNALGAGVREWIDQDGVDDAEDGAGSANPERQREDCGQREAGALAEFAEGVAEIGEQGLHEHLAWRSWRPFIDTWFDEKSSMMVRSKKKRKEKSGARRCRARTGKRLEAEDQAGRGARLILRSGVEMGEEIVDLDGADGEEGENFEVDADAERRGEGVLRGTADEYRSRAGVDGFVRAADEKMREGRNRSGETKLRAEEIGFQVRVRALERAGGVAEIGGERERAEDLQGAADFPTVEIERDLVGRGRAARDRAERGGLREGDGSAHERIAAEQLDALRVRRRSEQEYGENESAD